MRPRLKSYWSLLLSLSLCCVLGYAQELPEPQPLDSSADQGTDEPKEPISQSANNEIGSVMEPSASTSKSSRLPPIVETTDQSAAPDVYLLPDESGKLRKVIGFGYEDFLEAWKRGDAETILAPPRYVLDDWTVRGKVTESHVQLQVKFEIVVQSSGWVEIPIQLPELLVQKLEISQQLPGECLVFDKNRYGYVLWLSGESSAKRTLKLEGLSELKRSAGDHGLELHLPRATHSNFAVQVPASAADFQASPELTVNSVKREDELTDVELVGQANPVRLTWTVVEEQAPSEPSQLIVEETTTIQVDRRHATYNTTLLVNNFERPLQKIRVRLPSRAELKLTDRPGSYEITKVTAAADGAQHQEIEIRLPAPSLKPWSINLVAEQPHESLGDAAESRLEGFKVLDAFQQSGKVMLEVDDQLLAYFDVHDEVEQVPVDESYTPSEGRSNLGQFRYARFPWQIAVFTSPRQKRISVKPHYELDLSSDEARLEVEYAYQLTGAQIFSLRVDLKGWKRTEAPVESGGTIDPNSVVERHDGILALRLLDPSTPQLTVKLSFRKDLQLGENTFYFPEPTEAYLVDGELRFRSSEHLQLSPRFEKCVGLNIIADNRDESVVENSEYQAPANQFRLRTFLAQPKLVTEIATRQQEITVSQHTSVEVDRQSTRVQQDFAYQVKYKSVSQLSLSIPESLWQNNSLKITLRDEELSYGLSNSADDSDTDSSSYPDEANERRMRNVVVSLPRPMQDDIPLRLTYQTATGPLAVDELNPIVLPLASPVAQASQHEAEVLASPPVLISANQRGDTEQWSLSSEKSNDPTVRNINFRANENPTSLSLYAQLDSADDVQLATLERAWIQSWIAVGRRQERAVFRFRTPHPRAFVQLPEEFDNSRIELLLDGEPWPYELLDSNRLSVAFDTADQDKTHSLELRYQSPATVPSFGAMSSSVPQLECRVASAPIYWHLILPQGWQITTSPEQLIPDYWLGWRHYRWGRQPTLSQADLEQHTGAVPSMNPPPLSNQYVYRAFELPTRIQFSVIRQMWVFLICALGVFGIGLLCIYTSLPQNGYFWLGLAIALLLGILRYPEATILLIELILAGSLMTLVTHVLRRVLGQESVSSPTRSVQFENSELTESWQEQIGVGQAFTESTTTLKTGGPTQ